MDVFFDALPVFGGYVLAGALGFVLGVLWRERRMRNRRGERGVYRIYPLIGALTLLTLAMFVAMVIAFVQLGAARQTNAASKASVADANAQIALLRQQTRDNEIQSDCQQVALENMIAALLPRAAFAEQEADIQLAYAKRTLRFHLDPSPRTHADLVEADRVRIKALDELLASVSTDDLPSLTEIEACRN